jgi:importin-4
VLTFFTRNGRSIVRNALARVISSIAAIEMPHGQWNTLLPFVENACRSIDSPLHREIGAFILFSILEVVVEGLQNQVEAFLQLYATLLQDPQSLYVRIVTVRGLGVLAAYIDLEEKEEIVRTLLCDAPLHFTLTHVIHSVASRR